MSRWRPGLRERLLSEAAQRRAHAEQARAHAEALNRQLAQLRDAGASAAGRGGPPPRERLQRAETTYHQDRDQAHRTDVAELDTLHQSVGWRDTAASDAGEQRAALADEQQLRAEMDPLDRSTETVRRTSWIVREQRHAAQKRAAEEQHSRESYYAREHSRGLDRGTDHDLGR